MPVESVMNWRWIALAFTVPLALGILAAIPIWRRAKEPIIGGILGAFPVFICVVALIGREFIELQVFNHQCRALLRQHIVCHEPSPDAFTRFGIYCFIGMAQVFVLFILSQVVEGRRREGEFDLAWRGRPNG